MAEKVTIYLSGGIKKGQKDDNKMCFDECIKKTIKTALNEFDVLFLDPNDAPPDLSDSLAVFGCDLLRVKLSDFVLVDAREKRGIGVGHEMLFAKINKIPVVVVAPENTHYRRKNLEYLGQKIDEFIHPFISGPSDFVCNSFEEAAEWIKGFLESPGNVKGIECVDCAICRYKNTQLEMHKSVLDALNETKKHSNIN